MEAKETTTLTQEAARERAAMKAGILWALSQGMNRSAAARHNSVPRRTLYNWIKTDEEFRDKVEEAEHLVVDEMESIAARAARKAEEDPRYLRALFFWLECKASWIEARHTRKEAAAVPGGPARARSRKRPAHADPGLHGSDALSTYDDADPCRRNRPDPAERERQLERELEHARSTAPQPSTFKPSTFNPESPSGDSSPVHVNRVVPSVPLQPDLTTAPVGAQCAAPAPRPVAPALPAGTRTNSGECVPSVPSQSAQTAQKTPESTDTEKKTRKCVPVVPSESNLSRSPARPFPLSPSLKPVPSPTRIQNEDLNAWHRSRARAAMIRRLSPQPRTQRTTNN
ncbi:MAG TPA: helix-turn-helix domain-containing protein [Rhodothermales bacterium]|nr:helix-turn-helix domain-containing protein [Rhodothermales bacterium]